MTTVLDYHDNADEPPSSDEAMLELPGTKNVSGSESSPASVVKGKSKNIEQKKQLEDEPDTADDVFDDYCVVKWVNTHLKQKQVHDISSMLLKQLDKDTKFDSSSSEEVPFEKRRKTIESGVEPERIVDCANPGRRKVVHFNRLKPAPSHSTAEKEDEYYDVIVHSAPPVDKDRQATILEQPAVVPRVSSSGKKGHHMFKGLIESHFSVALSAASDEGLHYPLTYEEINAITYSAGYVLHAIKKKLFKVKTPCPLTKDMLLCLDDMISSDNEINGSRDWIQLVNRGGLTCVNSITYEVFLAMELQVVNTLVHNYKLSYTLNKEISVDDSVISYKGRTLALNTLRAKINPITGVAHTVNNGVRVSNGPEKEADIPECSGYASKTMASMDVCSQNDEDDETNASHSELEDSQITLDSEISCNAKDTVIMKNFEAMIDTLTMQMLILRMHWLMKKALRVK
eukprot:Em0007g1549a